MKSLVLLLVFTNLITLVIAYYEVRSEGQKYSEKVTQLDNFYYGFCEYSKEIGMGKGVDYKNLCGDI